MENLQVKDDIIIKSNNLIDCSYKLTLAEQRILNIACKRLKPMFVDKNISMNEFEELAKTLAFEPIEISVSDYALEYNSKNKNLYGELSKVADSLWDKEIIYFDEKDNLTRKRWLITCKYKDKEGKISLRFHPELVTDLLVFKGSYTRLSSNFLIKVKSFYASRLYELLRQYLVIGKRSFDLQELRFKLGLSDTEYPRYPNLKQRILKPSIDWINENSDIFINLGEDKCGTRSVKKVIFEIKSSNLENEASFSDQLHFELSEENSAYKKIREILNMDLTAEQAERICDSAIIGLKENNMVNVKSLDYIKEKWNIVKKYGENKPSEKFNPLGALISALKNNWETNKIIETSSKLKFNNFKGRDYNYDALEEMALGYIEYDSELLYKK